jgi:hypothetical protein
MAMDRFFVDRNSGVITPVSRLIFAATPVSGLTFVTPVSGLTFGHDLNLTFSQEVHGVMDKAK